MPEISFIIPAYNAEKTCRAAIESIICSDTDIEVIVIDDGSKDNTFQVCKTIGEKDSRVRVYSQNNKGVSAARNQGIRLAKGEYIGFIDSDDIISDNYMETVITCLKDKPDILIFGYSNMINGKRIDGWKPNEVEEPSELFHELLFHGGGLNSPCNKLFKNNLLHDTFNETKNMGEDLEFCCQYLKHIESCKVIPEELYLYNVDAEGSLTKKLDIVVDSIVEDISVLTDFTDAVNICNRVIGEKFYQRVEGVLGTINEYGVYQKTVNHFFSKNSFITLVNLYIPYKKKNRLIRVLILRNHWKTLYVYLACKRWARKNLKQ